MKHRLLPVVPLEDPRDLPEANRLPRWSTGYNLSRCIHLSMTSLDTTNCFANQLVTYCRAAGSICFPAGKPRPVGGELHYFFIFDRIRASSPGGDPIRCGVKTKPILKREWAFRFSPLTPYASRFMPYDGRYAMRYAICRFCLKAEGRSSNLKARRADPQAAAFLKRIYAMLYALCSMRLFDWSGGFMKK